MSRYLNYASVIVFLFFLYSCQKEVSAELGQISKGSLQSSSGDCLPKTVNGSFKTGQALKDSNYIEVTVNVTQTGSYILTTDTLNGYSFKATGSFSSPGANTVRLKGSGPPAVAGVDNFTVLYDSSACAIAVPVAQGTSGGGAGVFTLQTSAGSCMNANVGGTYTQGTAVTATNKVDIQVNVTTIGTWSITTAAVGGVSFSGSGNFTSTGVQTITLNSTGTPTTAGNNVFTVTAGSSSCTFTVVVAPNTTPAAVYTLQGSGSTCTSATPAGTYTQGTALTSANKLTVQVNVTTVGSWTVTTNTVGGMSFSGSGTFTTTGVQSIVLNGSGTPTTVGVNTFTVTAGSTTCTTPITVAAGTVVSGDHFILTDNSWWSYSTPISSSDTLKRQIVGSVTASGVTYKAMKERNVSGVIDDSLYFRKSGNNYWEFNYVDYYTSFFFDNPVVDSINFLREGLTTGATWSSKVYTDAENGVPTSIRFDYTCTNANATVLVNNKSYSNVYIITVKAKKNVNNGGFQDDVTWTNYYAQGIGWIYQKYDDGSFQYELPLRYYQVF